MPKELKVVRDADISPVNRRYLRSMCMVVFEITQMLPPKPVLSKDFDIIFQLVYNWALEFHAECRYNVITTGDPRLDAFVEKKLLEHFRRIDHVEETVG